LTSFTFHPECSPIQNTPKLKPCLYAISFACSNFYLSF